MESDWRWRAATINTTEGPYRLVARSPFGPDLRVITSVQTISGMYDVLVSVDGGLLWELQFRQFPSAGFPNFPYGNAVLPD